MTTETKPAEKTEPTTVTLSDLLSQVKTTVEKSNATVFEAVVDDMVKEEVADRKKVFRAAMVKRAEMSKNLDKINRPDQEHFPYDSQKRAVAESSIKTFSKALFDQVKKAKEELESLDKAITAAMTSGAKEVWDKLKEKVGKSS